VTASIDANILLRLVAGDVPEQQTVSAHLVGDEAHPVTVDIAALIEVAFALEHHYAFTRAACSTQIQEVLDLPTIIGEFSAFRSALILWATHPKLSLPDCYLAEKAQATNTTPLWTFDHELVNQHPAAQLAVAMPN